MTERHLSRFRRSTVTVAGAALLGLGGAIGALAVAETRPSATMAPATPTAIRSLAEGIVTVRGRVAEVYGDKFILQDASGRALIETGHRRGGVSLVQVGEQVTVQGRFDNGSIHAAFLVDAAGKVQALGPLGGGPEGRHHGPHDHRGGDDMDGPDRGPPPAPAAPAVIGSPADGTAAPVTAPTPS